VGFREQIHVMLGLCWKLELASLEEAEQHKRDISSPADLQLPEGRGFKIILVFFEGALKMLV